MSSRPTVFGPSNSSVYIFWTGKYYTIDGEKYKEIALPCGCCCGNSPTLKAVTSYYGGATPYTSLSMGAGKHYTSLTSSRSSSLSFSSINEKLIEGKCLPRTSDSSCSLSATVTAEQETVVSPSGKNTYWKLPEDSYGFNGAYTDCCYGEQTCTTTSDAGDGEGSETYESKRKYYLPVMCDGRVFGNCETTITDGDGSTTITKTCSETSSSSRWSTKCQQDIPTKSTSTCTSIAAYGGIIPTQTLWGLALSNFNSGEKDCTICKMELSGSFSDTSASVGGVKSYKLTYNKHTPTGYLKIWLRRKTYINSNPPEIVDVSVVVPAVKSENGCGEANDGEIIYRTVDSIPKVEDSTAESGSFFITFQTVKFSYLDDYDPPPDPATGGYDNGFPSIGSTFKAP